MVRVIPMPPLSDGIPETTALAQATTRRFRSPTPWYRRLLLVALATLTGGALLTWSYVADAARDMREEFLRQTQLTAEGANPQEVAALIGTAGDQSAPIHEIVTSQLRAVRRALPSNRGVYVLGRKPNGQLVSSAESGPSGAPDGSGAGLVLSETLPVAQRVFAERTPASTGPYTDGWGTWISVVVPINDPLTARIGLATPQDAEALVHKAVEYYRQHGRAPFLQEANDRNGAFMQGDLYAYAYDLQLNSVAHPAQPEMVGKNFLNVPDRPGGKFFRQEMQTIALTKGRGWVDYEKKNPLTKVLEAKTTYFELTDDLIICAGAYKGSGKIIAALGIDFDARDWNMRLVSAAAPPVIFTVMLTIILVLGPFLLGRLSRSGAAAPQWQWHIETALVVAAGLSITAFAVWVAHRSEVEQRSSRFAQLASGLTDRAAKRLNRLRDVELESLAGFMEHEAALTPQQFRRLTTYLTANPAVRSWEWIPSVALGDKEAFTSAARGMGMTDFAIWEQDAHGLRAAVGGRDVYGPILNIAPLVGNEATLGYDLRSDQRHQPALDLAAHIDLAIATDPVMIVEENAKASELVVYKRVFVDNAARPLQGHVAAVLRLQSMLNFSSERPVAQLQLSLLRPDAPAQVLASSDKNPALADGSMNHTRPLFVFGKTMAVTATPSPQFMKENAIFTSWVVGLIGGLLTIAVWQRRAAERTLRVAHAEAELLLSSISVVLIGLRSDDTISQWNASAEQIFGAPARKVIGGTLAGSGLAVSLDVVTGAIAQCRADRRPRELLDVPYQDANGRTGYLTIAIVANFAAGASAKAASEILLIGIESTARKVLEMQRNQGQKLESIGQLAAGIAHEINTPIQFIGDNLRFLRDSFAGLDAAFGFQQRALEDGAASSHDAAALTAAAADAWRKADLPYLCAEIPRATQQSIEGIERIAAIVRAMKEFSHPGQEGAQPTDLNHAIETTLQVARNEYKYVADVITDLDPDLPQVTSFLGELNQVFLNLIVNAAHAIRAAHGDGVKGTLSISTRKAGEFVELRFRDDGTGIPESARKKIFDPFFTTKPVGQGTGQGLYLAHAIVVQRHGGTISFETEIGKGTTFIIRLPLHRSGPT